MFHDFWKKSEIFYTLHALRARGRDSRRATTIHTPWFSPSSDSTPFRGFPPSVRLCHRVPIPQSGHLTAQISSLRFMEISAFCRASLYARAMRTYVDAAHTAARRKRSKLPYRLLTLAHSEAYAPRAPTPSGIPPSFGTAKQLPGCRAPDWV